MEKLRPQLLRSLADYSREKLMKDLIAGVIVAIIALPLSIALALASGVSPEQGLYTAIVAGFLVSALGGSKVQIAGPTAAFAAIVAGIVARNGMDGLAVATILAGILLVLMGLLRMGSMIKFIPYTITTGFTSGIAVTIVVGQLKDFFGVTFQNAPIETVEKLEEFISCFDTVNLWAVAVVVTAAMVRLLKLPVNTIGDLYTISGGLPHVALPALSYETVAAVLPDAFTIAILAAIESLLSCVVADEMIGGRHNSNMELVAQGIGNTASALFGGIPATGAIARTAANIKNGGNSPVAGMVHAVVVLVTLVFLMPLAALIPMPCIAAILLMVAYNMSGWRTFLQVVCRSPKSDAAVLLLTFFLTVVFVLVVAIGVGLSLACLLFMTRMANVAVIKEWEYVEDQEDAQGRFRHVPEHVMVYEIDGPMFFGAADQIPHIDPKETRRVMILRMRSVPALDITALNSLARLWKECQRHRVQLILSHVNEQPLSVMRKSGFYDAVGEEWFCPNIDAALELASKL